MKDGVGWVMTITDESLMDKPDEVRAIVKRLCEYAVDALSYEEDLVKRLTKAEGPGRFELSITRGEETKESVA